MHPSDPHFISIVVCTYNRVESLRRTLTALEALRIGNFSHELIVVDNNSTDGTWQFLEQYADRQQGVQVLREPRQGHSYALNTGITAARGDIIAFTDDDVRPTEEWLVRMLEVYDKHEAAAVGGRVVLEGNITPPRWLHRDLIVYLGLKDYGEELIVVRPPEALIGANMSVRKDVLDQLGGFNTDLGPRGSDFSVAYSADSDLCARISQLEGFGEVLYSPELVTYHAMMPGKLTRSYFRQRALGEGKAIALQEPAYGKLRLIIPLGRSIALSLRLGGGWLKRLREPDERFLREFMFLREWSALVAHRRAASRPIRHRPSRVSGVEHRISSVRYPSARHPTPDQEDVSTNS